MKQFVRFSVSASALALGFAAGIASAAPGDPAAKLDSGIVRGVREGDTLVFPGIPYAAPPAGALRWRAAQPLAPWTGVRPATHFGANCPQPRLQGQASVPQPPQSEDCLTINVVAPARLQKALRPVMVWVHGGAFFVGSGDEVAVANSPLVRRGVVLVSFNYRVGRFGFFAHPALGAEHPRETNGNYWLSDQIAALQWVQRNIRAFGGDAGNVTIFGVSAGGSSVNSLVVSPGARGLFRRAIVHSGGGVFNATRPLERALKEGQEVATRLGVVAEDPAVLAKLRALSPEEIIAHEPTTPDYGAIVDAKLLPADIAVAFARGDIARVSYVAGSTSDEASIFGLMGFDAKVLKERFGVRLDDLRAIYDPDRRLPDAQLLRQIQTDFIFTSGSIGLPALAARAGIPARSFRFAYISDRDRGRVAGVPHGGDMPYVLGTLVEPSAADARIVKMMGDYWVNFARRGDPDGPGLPRWPLYAGKAPETLVIEQDTKAVPDFRRAQLQPWFDKWEAQTGLKMPR